MASEIIKLKEEGLYPYDGEPEDELTKAERSVFDVFAVQPAAPPASGPSPRGPSWHRQPSSPAYCRQCQSRPSRDSR